MNPDESNLEIEYLIVNGVIKNSFERSDINNSKKITIDIIVRED